MKMMCQKLKNSALLFSLIALAGCGNMSASISSTAPLTHQLQNNQGDSAETTPLHDLGGSEYDDFTDEQPTEPLPDTTQNSNPDPQGGDTQTADPSAPKPADPKPTSPTKPADLDRKITELGVVKPTVYYFPVFNEDKKLCDQDEVKTLHGVNGEKLVNVCPSTLVSCGIQGSCAIIQKGIRRSFNISDRISGQDRYFEMTNTECRYGYGVKSACLDPFYTLAADLDVYNPGDVIYVPAVVGLKLPDGTTHNGYFIVRDQGRGINGKGRFDFYSGFLSWRDSKNPFRKLHLEDSSTQVPYAKITGAKAEQVLKSRAYPKLPLPPLK